eukprot:7167144-Prorocentrum_lima.AAC.1
MSGEVPVQVTGNFDDANTVTRDEVNELLDENRKMFDAVLAETRAEKRKGQKKIQQINLVAL